MRSRHIGGAWYELWAANRLQRHGLPMAFRPRSGVKGQDYEFDVEVGGERVAIEAKACVGEIQPYGVAPARPPKAGFATRCALAPSISSLTRGGPTRPVKLGIGRRPP